MEQSYYSIIYLRFGIVLRYLWSMKTRFKRDCLSFYHCMSRVCGRQMLLGDVEKEYMRRLIRRVEQFTGVKVLTYALMTNHIHLLLEEPDRGTVISDDEFRRRLSCLYSVQELEELYAMWAGWIADGCAALAQADKDRYLVRMHDISEFMKQVKQRFSVWYNRRNDRMGTLWDARFKSVLVEPGAALRVVAAYIEMNPVRAGMVNEPQHYHFCGFGEAMGGGAVARQGVARVAETCMDDTSGWRGVSTHYLERILMYDEVRRHPERMMTDHDYLRRKLGGRLALTDFERLMCKSRFFSAGCVIGGKEFVEEFFMEYRHCFGAKRLTGARKLKGGWTNIYAVRALVDWM
ncbi:MAG: hypothetical protein EOL87_09700 [Spartobacteria bacterium]|nr:hypothetical protein [Spartobacteria bacterium]